MENQCKKQVYNINNSNDKMLLSDVSVELFLEILDKYQVECQMQYNTGTVPDARECFAKNYSSNSCT